MRKHLNFGRVQVLLVLLLLGIEVVLSQGRFRRPSRNRQATPDTRLGLLATELGVRPVPGANPNIPGGGNIFVLPGSDGGGVGPAGGGSAGGIGNLVGPIGGIDDRCFCHPINQDCPADELVNLDLRIINIPGAPRCSSDKKECCLGGPTSVGSSLSSLSNIPFGTCGRQNTINLRRPTHAQASFAEYPWVALVLNQTNGYLGGGALISNEWIITAAHKIINENQRNLKIRLGDYDASQVNEIPSLPHFESPISSVIVHPNFDRSTLANNVALLRLARPLQRPVPHIGPVCLPAQGQLFRGQRCVVTGWGQDAFQAGSFSPLLKEVEVPMVDPFRCEQQLRNTRLGANFILDKISFLCAGGEAGRDACTGDGGAPLVCRDRNTGALTLAGMVAWGIGCATGDVPAAYVNVPTYVSFIRQYVR